MSASELTPNQLYHGCDSRDLSFETTDDLEGLNHFIGQPRAIEALHFGVGIRQEGYNIFALGESGTGKYTLIRQFLDKRAAQEDVPPDICYVNNFDEAHKPQILTLAPGKGKKLSRDMKQLVEDIRNALQAAFENEEFQNRKQTIAQEIQEKQQHAFEELKNRAKEHNLTALRTPAGLVFAPLKDGDVIPPDEFNKLTEDERRQIEEKAQELQQAAQKIFQKMPQWQREIGEKQKALNREVTQYTVGPLINEMVQKYEDNTAVRDYLKAVEKDIIENVESFVKSEGSQQQQMQQKILQQLSPSPAQAGGAQDAESPVLRRYQVNVLVDNSRTNGAPVVYEENPSFQNLMGRVEHLAQMGALVTDFNMIRAGALHRANGGYLILDALKVLREPFAWEGLKRALRSRQIKIESLGQIYSLISTVSLEPQPLPMNCKVVLIGKPLIYYLIRHYDSEFSKLFKVSADFAYEMNRDPKNQQEFARLMSTAIRNEKLRPFDREAVARMIEFSARAAGDGEKLSIHMQRLTDLLREADYWAGQNGNGNVKAEDVQNAIDSRIYRSDRLREIVQEQIQRDFVLIDTEGAKVGQINGISIINLGDFFFGRPNRITARIQLGKGEVVDIEREVAMGGPIHSKGVLILAGFLGARYAVDQPLSLSASLVFEQSYIGVEGDSASSAELYALLSAIAEVPIKQSLAVTGSVDQHGQVQPIGGVNEKIEGFFDTCKAKGFNGQQGVLIPASNSKHLMLRRDVIDAVKEGNFHIFPVQTIDEGIEILTGLAAGEADESGTYPDDSVNGKVHRRLAELAKRRLQFAQAAASAKGDL
jgi:lon-related putative ATP-dependent protease